MIRELMIENDTSILTSIMLHCAFDAKRPGEPRSVELPRDAWVLTIHDHQDDSDIGARLTTVPRWISHGRKRAPNVSRKPLAKIGGYEDFAQRTRRTAKDAKQSRARRGALRFLAVFLDSL